MLSLLGLFLKHGRGDREKTEEESVIGSRTLRLILLLVAVAVATSSLGQPVSAQQTTDDQQLSAELQGLIDRWRKTNDTEEAIAALKAALRLEPQIKQWTLKELRAAMKG